MDAATRSSFPAEFASPRVLLEQLRVRLVEAAERVARGGDQADQTERANLSELVRRLEQLLASSAAAP